MAISLGHLIASIARSSSAISKNVVRKNPARSSTTAKPAMAARAAPMRAQLPGASLAAAAAAGARAGFTNRAAARSASRTARTVGKNPVCGARRLPNGRRRLSRRMKIAKPISKPAAAASRRFMGSDRAGILRPRSTADPGDPGDLRPLALFFGVKFRRVRRAEVFDQRLGFFDVAGDLGIFETFAESGAEPLDNGGRRFRRREEAHPDFEIKLGKPFLHRRRNVGKILEAAVRGHGQ